MTAVVFDFDGVMTDNRAWVDEEGHERVAVHRGDGLGLSLLRKRTGIAVAVLSTETNPVVTARCRKLGLPVTQGVADKAPALRRWMADQGLDPASVVYVGNDVNDLPCFPLVGCGVAPADAHPEVLARADLVLHSRGGHGAVREICDMLMGRSPARNDH